ncbi:hypothetical protein PoB_001132700 [Plakobranchus ocellatus]|uniref:Uncharacterized protein n=1 Tax=Plakobranchus ocellatus TaxID=259542 RepID=A0AAV3YQR0_9GAST|nr:hypothetical protein PoB_001132700 [Plakobranchus ocellatus]
MPERCDPTVAWMKTTLSPPTLPHPLCLSHFNQLWHDACEDIGYTQMGRGRSRSREHLFPATRRSSVFSIMDSYFGENNSSSSNNNNNDVEETISSAF